MTDATATRPGTSLHQLADDRMRTRTKTGLDAYYRDHRSQGASRRTIALAIRDITGVDISEATLRNWYPEEETS